MWKIDPRIQRGLDALEPFRLSNAEVAEILTRGKTFTGMNDFRIPIMPEGRGRSADGGIPFHFHRNLTKREAVPILNGVPYPTGVGTSSAAATFFESYLRRHEAVQEVEIGQAAYITRPGAQEHVDPDDPENGAQEESEDLQSADKEGEPPGGFPPILSNISEDPRERQQYWASVYEHLPVPKTNYLVARPQDCPGFWAGLSPRSAYPTKLLEFLLRVRTEYAAYVANEAAQAKPFPTKKLAVTAEEAGEFLAALRQPGRSQPLFFRSGRGGRHQYQMAIELPHTIPPAARWRIMMRFCRLIEKLRLMYTAAHHRPGDLGDARNAHFHLIFHDRPARRMLVAKDVSLRTRDRPEGPPGAETILEWDFAVAVPNGSRRKPHRISYPFRQMKVEIVSQSAKRTKDENTGLNFFKWLRVQYSEIVNAVLRQYGQAYTYNPDRYEDMGVLWSPTTHLGPKKAALEADGFATLDGSRNAIRRYLALEEDLSREWTRRCEGAADQRKEFGRRVENAGGDTRPGDELILLLGRAREILQTEVAHAAYSIALLDLRLTATQSRALVADAAPYNETGKRSKRQNEALRAHSAKAGEYLDAHWEAWEPAFAGVEQFRAEAAARKQVLAEVDAGIEAWFAKGASAVPARLLAIAAAAVEREETRSPSKAPAGKPTEAAAPAKSAPEAEAPPQTPAATPHSGGPGQPQDRPQGRRSDEEGRAAPASQPSVRSPQGRATALRDGANKAGKESTAAAAAAPLAAPNVVRTPAQTAAPASPAGATQVPPPDPSKRAAPPSLPAPLIATYGEAKPAEERSSRPSAVQRTRDEGVERDTRTLRDLALRALMLGKAMEPRHGNFELPDVNLSPVERALLTDIVKRPFVQRILGAAYEEQRLAIDAVVKAVQSADVAPIDEDGAFAPKMLEDPVAIVASALAAVPEIRRAAERQAATERRGVDMLLDRIARNLPASAVEDGAITFIAGLGAADLLLLNAPAHRKRAVATIEASLNRRRESVAEPVTRTAGTAAPRIEAEDVVAEVLFDEGSSAAERAPQASSSDAGQLAPEAGGHADAADAGWERDLAAALAEVRDRGVRVDVEEGRHFIDVTEISDALQHVFFDRGRQQDVEDGLRRIIDEQLAQLSLGQARGSKGVGPSG